MKQPEKFIFLDIDGPMIPATSYLSNPVASFDQELDDRCVMVLKKIIEKSGAKIVFNTSHASALYPNESEHHPYGLIPQFEKAGLGDAIHETRRTLFPEIAYTGFDESMFMGIVWGDTPVHHQHPHHHPRLAAIFKYLEDNDPDGTAQWIALDDVSMPHERAFTVSYEHGIGIDAYDHAAEYLNFGRLYI